MRTIDDVTSQLVSVMHFSILDVTHLYWSIKPDEKSSYLTTMSISFGRFSFLKMPFGLKTFGRGQ